MHRDPTQLYADLLKGCLTRALFEDILKDEEHHVDYLEGQLHAIEEIGLDNFLAQQLHKGEEKD